MPFCIQTRPLAAGPIDRYGMLRVRFRLVLSPGQCNPTSPVAGETLTSMVALLTHLTGGIDAQASAN
jgi:hypothetical protein